MAEPRCAKTAATVKVIVLGQACVGKSSLIERYVNGRYSQIRKATIGADFFCKKLSISETEVTLMIWDTAGQEMFHRSSLGSQFYRGSNGALLVYDVSNEASIEQLVNWKDELLSRVDPNIYFPVVVIGNKVDLLPEKAEEVEVSTTQPERSFSIAKTFTTLGSDKLNRNTVRAWCDEMNFGFIETSAKDNRSVEAAFLTIAALALENQTKTREMNPNVNASAKVNLSQRYDKKKSCC